MCELCCKWRRLPWHVNPKDLGGDWVCADNKWTPEEASCDVRRRGGGEGGGGRERMGSL
ncbi:unnamed protein product [Discosporangium mesarthrocarpum]